MHRCNTSGLAPLCPFANHSQWEGHVTSPSLFNPENVTSDRPMSGPIAAMLSMTLGILSNIVALLILANAYARLRRRSKAFLLFASSLVATDFVGHVIPGSIVMRLYLSGGVPSAEYNRSDPLCQFLGGSMVFFGLCPLFLGCAMAAERCLGVTKPLLHASLVTTTRTKVSLSFIWMAALCVALLPCFKLGSYTYQYPGTWCFIKVLEDVEEADVAFVMLFSGLGMTSLAVALVCNTVSGLTLVLARIRKQTCNRRSARSHDIEMVVQLVGIMVTSCICWSPLLASVRNAIMVQKQNILFILFNIILYILCIVCCFLYIVVFNCLYLASSYRVPSFWVFTIQTQYHNVVHHMLQVNVYFSLAKIIKTLAWKNSFPLNKL